MREGCSRGWGYHLGLVLYVFSVCTSLVGPCRLWVYFGSCSMFQNSCMVTLLHSIACIYVNSGCVGKVINGLTGVWLLPKMLPKQKGVV